MRAIIAIPTYWTWPRGTPPRPSDAVFDHPTPVDGGSTLPRLLDSLLAARRVFPFDILVIAGVVDATLGARTAARVHEILAARGRALKVGEEVPDDGPDPVLYYVSHDDIVALQERMARAGLPRAALSPYTYPGIRNVHLLLSYAMGYDLIVALDDDEVVPHDYFVRLHEGLEANPRAGLAGLYLNEAGSPYLPTGPRTGNIFQDKAHWMNEALRALMESGERWQPTHLAFGGNMVFRRPLIQRVGFDPYITRGEDIDYVLNATMAGEPFVLDSRLHIVHKPPHEYETHPYAKLAEDVRRFLYEREKVRLARAQGRATSAEVERLVQSPYPGRFLAEDVEEHALAALRALADEEATRLWGTPEAIVEEAMERARTLAPHYAAFTSVWPTLISNLQYPISDTQYPTFDTQP